MELIQLFHKFVEYYGHTAAAIIMVIIVIVYSVYLIIKNYSSLIKRYLEKKLTDKEKAHVKAAIYRKNITPKIREELSELARKVGADRALVFEFSNGSSNLIGLPFLYFSATSEVVSSGTSAVSYKYQKINTSIIAEFLEDLEDKGYFYTNDIEDIRESLPILYGMMKPDGTKSVLFYTLRGMGSTIGFMVISSVGDKSFTRADSLSKTSKVAQVISSYLNYSQVQEVA